MILCFVFEDPLEKDTGHLKGFIHQLKFNN